MRKILEGLEQNVLYKAEIALDELDRLGIKYVVTEGKRSLLTQCLYALQGRLDDIPKTDLEWACKLSGVRQPDKNKITWTLKSNHLNGNAIDIYPFLSNGNIDWDWTNTTSAQHIVNELKSVGFTWGGDWKQKDNSHFEIV